MMRFPGSASLAAGAALVAAAALAQVDRGFEPVPAALLSERTLRVPEENFSMRAPGPEFEWLRSAPAEDTGARSYLCRNLRTGERLLLTVGAPSSESASKYGEEWLARIKATQEAQGRELVGPRSDPSDAPAAGAYRLSTMITGPGATIYFTGYVLGAGRIYALQHYSDSPGESPSFGAFARSFKLLDPAATPSLRLFGGVRVVLGILLALALLLIAARALGRVGRGRRR
jgi:hypothetical protein